LYSLRLHTSSPTFISSLIPSNLTKVQVTPKSNSSKGFSVEVYNTEGKLLNQFNSIYTAAKVLGLQKTTIQRSANKGRLCKGVYFFKLIPNN
jgi:hypothetical protein